MLIATTSRRIVHWEAVRLRTRATDESWFTCSYCNKLPSGNPYKVAEDIAKALEKWVTIAKHKI